ncbi:pancreatic secretory granule membrane major glycoprotein GP2-like [Anomaloglossus baeobatrachus]
MLLNILLVRNYNHKDITVEEPREQHGFPLPPSTCGCIHSERRDIHMLQDGTIKNLNILVLDGLPYMPLLNGPVSASDPVLCSTCGGGACTIDNGCSCNNDPTSTCVPTADCASVGTNICCPTGYYWSPGDVCCTATLLCNPSCQNDLICKNISNVATCGCNTTLYNGMNSSSLAPLVKCGSTIMTVSLSKCLLEYLGYDSTSLQLNNNSNSCGLYSETIINQTMQTIQALPLSGWCGNLVTTDSSKVYYTNTVQIGLQNKSLITVNPANISFSCSYNTTLQTSMIAAIKKDCHFQKQLDDPEGKIDPCELLELSKLSLKRGSRIESESLSFPMCYRQIVIVYPSGDLTKLFCYQTNKDIDIWVHSQSTVNISISGQGTVVVTMEAYWDQQYTVPVQQTEDVPVGSNVYLGVLSDLVDTSKFVLRVDSCYATPDNNINNVDKVAIVSGGCPANQGVTAEVQENGLSAESRIKFNSFAFQGQPLVYISCIVRLCDKNTTCTGCNAARAGDNSASAMLQIPLNFIGM